MTSYLKRILSLFIAAALTTALLPLNGLIKLPTALAASNFSDTAGHPNEAAINRWAGLGVVSGSNGKFEPDRAASRIEFYSFINRALACAAKKNISRFTDVSTDNWYYSEVQYAVAAGLTNGVAPDKFGAEQELTREMAVTILGRIFRVYTENTSGLSIYSDNTAITYGRGYLAAFAQMGITLAIDGKFEPNRSMTRAETVALLDSFFTYVYTNSDILSNRAVTGNVLIRTPGITIEKMTLTGNLILGDGVGAGSITLKNCVINGRLVVRGGGPNSINLSGTTITNGVYVYNANSVTRLYSANSGSKVGEVTAMTGVILEGSGFGTLYIPEDAVSGANFTLRSTSLDSVNVSQPNANIALTSGTVDNFRFLDTASQSELAISVGAKANYAEICANDVDITGGGYLDTLYIDSPNARVSMFPRYRYITPGLTASVNGVTVSGTTTTGSTTTGTASNVVRASSDMAVTRDISSTGGTGLTLKTSAVAGGTEVAVTQDKATNIILSSYGRLGYWVGFFIPVPAKYQDPVVKAAYTFEGASDALYSIPVETKDGIDGISLYIPVKAGGSGTGTLDTTISITWGDATYERIKFYGTSALTLAAPSSTQITTMVSYFLNTLLPSYNRITTYSGTEALKRLLLGDNALGLDIRAFESYTDSDKNSFVAQMYYDRAQLTTKTNIQNYLNGRLTGEIGALYAINNAMSALSVKNIVESSSYATQLGIETGSSSAYAQLSSNGKLAAASAVLAARNAIATTVFANEAAVATAFNKAVTDRRKLEVTTLAAVNSSASGAALQKVLENKTNAEVIGISTDGDPYKPLTPAVKLGIATKIYASRQFSSLDLVKSMFVTLLADATAPVPPAPPIDPKDNPNILGVSTDLAAVTLIVNQSETITPSITTTSGSFSDVSAVSWAVDKTALANVDPFTGVVTAKSKGTAKVTVTSKADTKKKTTVTVNVVDPVAITYMSISPPRMTVGIGYKAQANLTKVPATGNDKIYWSSDDPKIATVSEGVITGVSTGFTTIMAWTTSGVRATCDVFVAADTTAILIDKTGSKNNTIEIGLNCVVSLRAAVSPATVSNTKVNWSSNAASIASVDSNGNVTGNSYGTVEIKATANGYDVYDTITISVVPNKYGVMISDNSLNMYKNGIFQLSAVVKPDVDVPTPSDIIWSVVDNRTDIVTVSSNGLVTAKSPGTAIVTATYVNDTSATDSCVVVVSPSNLTVTVTPNKAQQLVAGNSFYINVTFSTQPENTKIIYSSTDTNVAVVDENGKVTGIAPGPVKINVTPQASGTTTQIEVTVTSVPLVSFSIQSSLTVLTGSKTPINVMFVPENVTNKKLMWASNSHKVSVSDDGYITAHETTYATDTSLTGTPTSLKNYPVEITATAPNGSKSICTVTVVDTSMGGVDSVDILLNTWVFPVGSSQNLSVVFNGGDQSKQPINKNVTWSSSMPGVATVSNSGFLQTVGPGTAVITAVSEDGAKESVKTIVVAPVGVEQINFTGLDANISHGRWVQMTGKPGANTKNVTGTAYPGTATNKKLGWFSDNPEVVSVDANGKLTANPLNPGVAKVTVTAQSMLSYSNEMPSHSSVNLAESGISRTGNDIDGYKYFDPNGRELNSLTKVPLVVNRLVSNSFMVWAAPAVPEDLNFQGMSGKLYKNDTVTITANVAPANALIDKVVWTFTNKDTGTTETIVDTTAKSLTHIFALTESGDVVITCTITMNEYAGPDTTNWDGRLPNANPLKLPKTEKTVSQSFTVESRPVTSVKLLLPNNMNASDIYETQPKFLITPEILPANASTRSLDWRSSSQAIASVDANGFVTINGTGSVTIYAKPKGEENVNAAEASITFTVKPLVNPTTVSINGNPTSIEINKSVALTAALTSSVSDAFTYQELDWSSSDTTIATVTGSGLNATVTSLSKTGKVTITVKSRRATTVSASCEISVVAGTSGVNLVLPVTLPAPATQPTSIKLRGSAKTVVGGSITLYPDILPANADAIVWKTSDSSVATVNKGIVRGVSAGRATITLSSTDGKVESTCTVTVVDSVSKPVTGFKLSKSTLSLVMGRSSDLDAVVTPSGATLNGVGWYSNNPLVATVDRYGKVTAVSGGTAIIIAVTDEGQTASCTVTVSVRVSSLTINISELSLSVNESFKLTVSILPADATVKDIKWKSSVPTVVSVDENGTVKALKKGTATITATCDGRTVTCKIAVK